MKTIFARESYLPKPETIIETLNGPAGTNCLAYIFSLTVTGRPPVIAAKGFGGKRAKPDFYYTFKTEEKAREYIARYFDGQKKTAEMKAGFKAKRIADRCGSPLEVWEKARVSGNISPADVAVCLRAVLARKFPGVKFSVRSDSGLNVSWFDGPRADEVKTIA